jgi:hypothetical protein
MYNIFELPHNFLDRQYTEGEKKHFDSVIDSHCDKSLNEDLTDKQKKTVDKWDVGYNIHREHNDTFGKGVDRITEPLEKSKEKLTSKGLSRIYNKGGEYLQELHHNVVNNHLMNNGYYITDYAAGHAMKTRDVTKDEHGGLVSTPVSDKRTYNIGKVLSATGGDTWKTGITTKPKYAYDVNKGTHIKDSNGNKIITEHPKQLSVSQAYAADPIRAASKGEANIHYTRNKYDVAGASTDRGWKSCMDMDEGSNAHYLKHDIHSGTVSAYLTKKDDSGISSPIARINLKRHNPIGGDSSAKAIYRPEGVYGTAHPDFHNQVSKWAEKTWPMHHSAIAYAKDSSVYNDNRESIIHNPSASVSHLGNEKMHDTINTHIRNTLRDAENNIDHKNDFGGFDPDDHRHHGEDVVDAFLKTRSEKANHAFHAIHTIDTEHSGENDSDKSFGKEGYEHDEDSKNANNLHLNAVHYHADARNLDDSQLEHHLRTYNTKFGDKDEGHREDGLYERSKEAHNDLMTNALSKPHLSHLHDEILHHFAENPHYHAAIHDNNNHPFLSGAHDPIQKTTNPRIIHKLLDTNSDHWSRDNLAHAGMYADQKLANHVAHHPDSSDDSDNWFVKGLNHNEHGEKIQHELTSGMYLSGGKSKYGDLKNPATTMKHAKNIVGGTDHSLRTPGTNDAVHNSMFHAIANNSHHKSVLHKISTRSDIPNEVQNMAKEQMNHVHGIKESVSKIKTKTLQQIRNGK